MLLVDDLAAGGTKNLRHTPRGLVTLYKAVQYEWPWMKGQRSDSLTFGAYRKPVSQV